MVAQIGGVMGVSQSAIMRLWIKQLEEDCDGTSLKRWYELVVALNKVELTTSLVFFSFPKELFNEKMFK
jgi:hypothetical protein